MKITLLILALFLIGLGCASLFRTKDCRTKDATYENNDFKVSVAEYRSDKKTGSVLILPPTGGENLLDRKYANELCEAGFDVFILKKWTGDDEYNTELSIHTRFYARAQKAIETVFAHVETPFIGILGTSVGALHTAVAVGVQPRLNAAFVITGGAPIADIIARSDQGAMEDVKKKRFKIYGFKNEEEYLAALDKVLPLDPFKNKIDYQQKSLGMIIATKDTTVPTEFQERLRQLWGTKVVYDFSSSHFMSILKSWYYHSEDIVKFFTTAAATTSQSRPEVPSKSPKD